MHGCVLMDVSSCSSFTNMRLVGLIASKHTEESIHPPPPPPYLVKPIRREGMDGQFGGFEIAVGQPDVDDRPSCRVVFQDIKDVVEDAVLELQLSIPSALRARACGSESVWWVNEE
jgi:hypothetical protein